jgi:hypothetical protein
MLGKPEPVIYTPDIRKKVESGELSIVVHGSLTYMDIFGVNHWMHFCAFSGVDLATGSPLRLQ